MNKKVKKALVVSSQERLGEGIFSLELAGEEIAEEALPGQFLSLYCKDKSRLLPRPVSICRIDRGRIRLVYRVVGEGTMEFSHLTPGDTVEVLGPLGNGFPIDLTMKKRVLLIGGGMGIPPLLECAARINGEVIPVLGYRDQIFLKEEFEPFGKVYFSTEDGSAGLRGNVLDVIRTEGLTGDLIFSCGPAPMLRAVKELGIQMGIPCYLSLEERMACGMGACLACVCPTPQEDEHSRVCNKRVCRDGPVFLSTDVLLPGEVRP